MAEKPKRPKGRQKNVDDPKKRRGYLRRLEKIHSYSDEAIDFLGSVLRDDSHPVRDRIKASEVLLARSVPVDVASDVARQELAESQEDMAPKTFIIPDDGIDS